MRGWHHASGMVLPPKWGGGLTQVGVVVEKFRKIWFLAQFAQFAAILAPSPHVPQLLSPPRKYNILLYMWSGHWAIFQAKQNTFLHKTRPHAPFHTANQRPHCVNITIAYFVHPSGSIGPRFVAKTVVFFPSQFFCLPTIKRFRFPNIAIPLTFQPNSPFINIPLTSTHSLPSS